MKTIACVVIGLLFLCAFVVAFVIDRHPTRVPADNTVERTIQISRKGYFPPREWHWMNEGVIFRVWDFAPDPTFTSTRYLDFPIIDPDGTMHTGVFSLFS